MSRNPADLDAYLDACAAALELPVEPAWKPAIRDNLKIIFAHAEKVSGFPLDDEAEPAPVFRA